LLGHCFENPGDQPPDILRAAVIRVAPDFSQSSVAVIMLLILHAIISLEKSTGNDTCSESAKNCRTQTPTRNSTRPGCHRPPLPGCDQSHISRSVEKAGSFFLGMQYCVEAACLAYPKSTGAIRHPILAKNDRIKALRENFIGNVWRFSHH
jgi:hypothetical protein